MPELPEVETVRKALNTAMTDGRVRTVMVSGKAMRWPIPPHIKDCIEGAHITSCRRRGKYLLLDMTTQSGTAKKGITKDNGDWVMLLHLGMSGSIRIYPDGVRPDLRKHDHFVIDMDDGQRIVLNDPRRFGGVDVFACADEPQHRLLRNMGIEPLDNSLNGAFLKHAFKNKSASVKSALLDQRIVAGIGNIYACEALFFSGISPKRKAGNIGHHALDRLADAIIAVLRRAIEAGGTSLRDHVQPQGELGYFAQELMVYGRQGEACLRCDTAIKMIRQSGRASFYCPLCQH